GRGHLAETDDVWFVGPLVWLGAWADADAVLDARVRRGAGQPQPAGLTEEVRALVAERERSARFVPASTLAYVALADAEMSRLGQSPDPDRWQAAAAVWESLGHPYPLAYARWREAEALLLGRRGRAAETPLREAHEVA